MGKANRVLYWMARGFAPLGPTGISMSGFLKRTLYVLYVVVFVVLTSEIVLRGLFSDPEYYWKNRFSFVSPKVYQNHGDGLWTYRPHAAIREVARLRLSGANFMIFVSSTFWWLEYYPGLKRYLYSNFSCALKDDRLLAFDLHTAAV